MRTELLYTLPLALTPLANAQCDEIKLVAADGDTLDRFGYSIDIDGDRLLVPAKHEEAPLADQGALYVYDWDGSAWLLDEKILASDAQAGDLLGWAASLEGDRILAGAVFHDAAFTDQGAAYVFERDVSGWNEVIRLEAANGAEDDYYGRSVALEGDLAVIGAPLTERAATNSGSCYVYERIGGVWTFVQELWPADGGTNDRFGWDLDLDGERIVVGSYLNDEDGSDAGAVYVFERSLGSFTQTAKLLASDTTGELGWAISADGGVIAAGAAADATFGNRSGATYVFQGAGASWTEVAKLLAPDGAANDRFGADVALNGGRILIGAQLDDDGENGSGSAYLYSNAGGGWSFDTKLNAGDPEDDARYGRYVDLDDDRLVVGAIHEDQQGADAGAAYIYVRGSFFAADCFCPTGTCGNDDTLAGCENSTGAGASLSACGTPSVLADDLVLSAEGVPAGFFGLVYMGGGALDLPFGDGRRCIGSNGTGVHRFPVRNSGAGGVLVEGPGIVAYASTAFPVAGQITAGNTWRFQAWFRDPGGPCGGGFNLSNAIAITFQP